MHQAPLARPSSSGPGIVLVLVIVFSSWIHGVHPEAALAASARPIVCERVDDGAISVDGLRNDWQDQTVQRLTGAHVAGGDKSRWQGTPDLLGKLRCAHDSKGTYLLLEVDDDQVVRTARFTTKEDRVELLFKGSRGKLRILRIHPPSASFPKGRVRWASRPYPPRKIDHVVIRLKHGYAVELGIRDGAVPGYRLGSPKLAMTLRIVDHDGGPSRKADTVMVTGGQRPRSLGTVRYDTANKLLAQFLKAKGLTKGNILHHEVGNFITGRALEQLVIAGTWIAFLGEDVMKGGAYYAFPVPMARSQNHMLRFRTVDLDGNGNKDVVLVVREDGTHGLSRDLLLVFRFLDTGKPDLYFAHEVAVRRGDTHVLENDYRFVRHGKKTDIVMTVGKDKGWTKANHRPTGGGQIEPLLTPWGEHQKKRYAFASDGYTERR